MAGRHIARGDRHETGEAGLRGEQVVAAGIERILGDDIADGKQAAVVVEEEIELHGVRHGARRGFDRMQPALQRRRRLGARRDVATMALDRALRGFDPEQHVGARLIGPFVGERASQIGCLAGVDRQIVQSIRKLQ